MTQIYLEKLSDLVNRLKIEEEIALPLVTGHFFSGAALYINNTICVSWSPAGLAFKLPAQDVDALISSGKAKALRYFPKGHIKKSYALFEYPDNYKPDKWKKYFITAAKQVCH